MTPDQLKKWRKKYKLTQKEAAEVLGLGFDAVQSYEQGRRPISESSEIICKTVDEVFKLYTDISKKHGAPDDVEIKKTDEVSLAVKRLLKKLGIKVVN